MTGLYLSTRTKAYAAWQASHGADREALELLATTPQATWLDDPSDPDATREQVRELTRAAHDEGSTAVLAVYAIPGRDCGHYSAGGAPAERYGQWVREVAAGICGAPIVVLEPDALPQLGAGDHQGDRVAYLADAAQVLHDAGARVYLDAGHSSWLTPREVVRRVELVGTQHLTGIALNTSNYQWTADERGYGEAICAELDLRFVVDTSRNGRGSDGEWCNARGRAVGDLPRLVDDGTACDALLWVKPPGESDGTGNGGPAAGAWWQEIALELVRNAT
ncbi:glycoside hydrolase family 6 protein [Cellulomonas sp. PSBB021]|uniref:glycoside hydrolase family 6 protein n=1 Tax=Cellulomonas sp. PSBB021 TaxID=2003551 RepID=UPI0012FE5A4A|nr:glycoside hydrolase family 6 protein [Cellulomonas sp. PSBB021]